MSTLADIRQARIRNLIADATADFLLRPMSPRNIRGVNAAIHTVLARLIDAGELPPGVKSTDMEVITIHDSVILEPRGELRRWLEDA